MFCYIAVIVVCLNSQGAQLIKTDTETCVSLTTLKLTLQQERHTLLACIDTHFFCFTKMIPPNSSLVKYDNPVLVSRNTEKKTPKVSCISNYCYNYYYYH